MAVTAYIAGEVFDVAYMGEFSAETSDLTARSMEGGTANAGAAHPQRVLIGLITWGSSSTRTLSSATIYGVTASIVVQTSFAAGGAAIVVAEVPDDDEGDFSMGLSFSGITTSCQAAIVRAVGLNSPTAHDFGADEAGPASVPATAIDIPSGGFQVAASFRSLTAATTWTGATEQYDAIVESDRMSFAYDEGMSLEAARAISTQVSATGENTLVVAASFR